MSGDAQRLERLLDLRTRIDAHRARALDSTLSEEVRRLSVEVQVALVGELMALEAAAPERVAAAAVEAEALARAQAWPAEQAALATERDRLRAAAEAAESPAAKEAAWAAFHAAPRPW